MTRSKKATGRVTPASEPVPEYVAPRRAMKVFFVYFVVALMVLSLAGGVIGLIVAN